MFQFPTGWNSTQSEEGVKWVTCVSIPNGMEFYYTALSERSPNTSGFNSQRDGILRFLSLSMLVIRCSFNSQRDGILRSLQLRCISGYIVSIPNGMEFYHMLGFFAPRSKLFQFPTGWNSTLSSLCVRLGLCCFNSQRDGILLYYVAV